MMLRSIVKFCSLRSLMVDFLVVLFVGGGFCAIKQALILFKIAFFGGKFMRIKLVVL